MRTFPCTFIKIISGYEEQCGNSVVFSVHPYRCGSEFGQETVNTGIVTCKGFIPPYRIDTPLFLTYNEKEYEEGSPVSIEECIERTDDGAVAAAYINASFFNKSNPTVANALVDTIGIDIFGAVNTKNGRRKIYDTVKKDKAETIINELKGIVEQRYAVQTITAYGGTCRCAIDFCKQYGNASLNVLKKNPYILQMFDVPFCVYDKIADDYGFSPNNDKRIEAVIHEVTKQSERNGNTCITLKELFEKSKKLVSNHRESVVSAFDVGALLAHKKEQFICEEIELDEKITPVVYRAQAKKEEDTTAEHIARILSHAPSINVTSKDIENVEAKLKINYADGQKEAFQLLDKSGIGILTGGPGTGKTTTLNGLLQCFSTKRPDASVALCAPTAAAAKRMKESTGRSAYTIHKLLDIRPTGFGGYTSKNEFNQLDYDLVVVDESSMVDLSLFSILVSSIKSGANLLLLGDKDQLASVGAGDVLHDLMSCQKIKQTHLSQIYRQANTSSIVTNSVCIRTTHPEEMTFDSESQIMHCKTEEELVNKTIETMKEYYDVKNPFNTRLFSTARQEKFPAGTESLNKELQKVFNPHTAAENILTQGFRTYAVGDPVVFTKNNYDEGYLNGDTGIIIDIEKTASSRRLVIHTEQETLIISGQNILDVSLAYATTVHKSQGSECDTAIIILPNNPAGLLRNDLLYVAATRAKKRNIFIVQDDKFTTKNGYVISTNTLERGICNVNVLKRTSGLLHKIRKTTGEK